MGCLEATGCASTSTSVEGLVRWPVLVPFWVGLVLLVGRARAGPRDDAPYALTYRAPVVCPSEATFVADMTSHARTEANATGIRLNFAIDEQETGYLGTLVVFDKFGNEASRDIHGKACSDVAHALAFLGALAIELGGHIEPEPPLAPTPPVGMIPPPPSARAAAPTPSRSVEVSSVLLTGLRGGFGPVARLTGEAGVEIGARSGKLVPSVRLSAFVGDSDLAAAGGSAALWMVGGRLEACAALWGNIHILLRPCLGSEVGLVRAQGQAALESRTAVELWASVEGTLKLQWFPTKGFFAELGGGPVIPVVRTHYYFEPGQTLYVVPWLTARAAGGLGLQF